MPASSAKPGRDSAKLIREALQTILASNEFAGSERLCRFLRFIVEQRLEGNLDSLKETVIGVEVFDRSAGYDPKLEPIVRVEARRLRSHLDTYYQSAGKSSTVRISIPKGGYVPEFEFQESNVVALPARPAPVPRPASIAPARWPWRMAAIGIGSLIVLGVIAWAVFHTPRHSASLPVDVKVTSFPGWEREPSFSPDGSQLAFSWDPESNGHQAIYLIMASGGQPRRLTSPIDSDRRPAWSPDGNTIAFIRGLNEVMLTSPLGGAQRKLTESRYDSLAWAPDSRSLAIVDRLGNEPFSIFEVSVSTGERRRLTFPPPEQSMEGDFTMAYSPDGTKLAFARTEPSRQLLLLTLSTGSLVTLAKVPDHVTGITWMPNGREIIYSSGPTSSIKLFRLSISPPGNPTVVPTFVAAATEPVIGRMGVGPHAGIRLAYVSQEQRVEIWEQALARPGTTPNAAHRVIASTSLESSPQFSPGGGRIAFVSARTGFDQVWTSGADGQDAVQLTFFREGSVGSPRWSPDGQRLAFDYLTPQGRALYVVNAKGGAPIRWTSWGELGRPSWSRDGRWIYFFWARSGNYEVWKVAAADNVGRLSQPVQVTTQGGFEAYESLDGAWLFYNRGRQLWRQPVAGGKPEHVLDGVWHGWWAIASKGIYFVDLSSGHGPSVAKAVNFLSFETHRVSRVAAIDGEVFADRPDFCVSPDGARMLYGIERISNADIHMLEPFE